MSDLRNVPLSVLDLAPIPEGSTAREALRATFDPADRRRSFELVADIAAQARSGGAAAPEESAPGLVSGRGRSS